MSDGPEPERAVTVRERRWPGSWFRGDEIDRFFEQAMHAPWLPHRFLWARRIWREAEWVPDMDVFERDGKTVVRVDLPGMIRDDIEVAVERGMLVIRGHRDEEKIVEREDYTYSERAAGEFSRAISLSEGVDEDDIEATYADGVLEVVVPVRAEAEPEPKKIAVK